MLYKNIKFENKPLAIVLGFAGCKLSTIKKYSNLWENNQFNVIAFTPAIDLTLLSNRNARDKILDEINEFFKNVAENKRKLIFHGISIGNGVMSTIIGKMFYKSKNSHLIKSICGIVVDSGPIVSVDMAFKGFKKTLNSTNNPINKIKSSIILPFFTPFWKYYIGRNYKYLIANNKINYLIIHNPTDEYLPGASSIFINQLKNNQLNHIDESNLTNDKLKTNNNELKYYIIEKQFDSPHAKHLINYPIQYQNSINLFISAL